MPGQIVPGGIAAFDECYFFLTPPRFDFFFPRDCVADVFVRLEVDEAVDAVARCEALHFAFAVLNESSFEVVGYADVKVARAACEYVDAERAGHERDSAAELYAGRRKKEKAGKGKKEQEGKRSKKQIPHVVSSATRTSSG
jgi:hypothetical protein